MEEIIPLFLATKTATLAVMDIKLLIKCDSAKEIGKNIKQRH